MMYCNLLSDYSNQEIVTTKNDNDQLIVTIKSKLLPTKLSQVTFRNMVNYQDKIKISIDFKPRKTEIMNREDFEGDLSVLSDQYDEHEINDKMIQKEISKQYKEYKKSLNEFGEDLILSGSKWLLPFTRKNITIKNLPKTQESISFQLETYFGLISSIESKKIDIA